MDALPLSQRLPREEFRYSNFPEVATLEEQLVTFFGYVDTVNSAVIAYQENETEKIYLNVAELQRMLNLSFDITDILGRAPNVCYDILMNVRELQEGLNNLIFAHLSQGNYFVSSEPLVASEDQEGDE